MNQRLFKASLFILATCIFGAIFQLWQYSRGIPINTDLFFMTMYVVAPTMLLYISNKYWRLGLLFVIPYGIAKELSAMLSGRSMIVAILLSLLSILFLIPGLVFFLKLRVKKME